MKARWIGMGLGAIALVGTTAAIWFFALPPDRPEKRRSAPRQVQEASLEQVRQFCGVSCHTMPPPDSFPRDAWRKEVEQGVYFARKARPDESGPSLESVLAFYEKRAPLELPLPLRPVAAGKPGIRWDRTGYTLPGRGGSPEVVNVNPVRLTTGGQVQILVCECDPLKNVGRVLLFTPDPIAPVWKELATLPGPVHTAVVDLNRDGHLDIVVACLGKFFPSDEKVGSVVWLRGRGDGTYEPITLLRDIGRVANLQAADFQGRGTIDLVVAEFGWRETGNVLLLENHTTDWAIPKFVPRVLDDRHGAISVAVADLNGDGKQDFVALISQEHETVVAFLNEGNGKFRKETIYTAPHPAYGSSGIDVVDLDGDGDLDVVYSNGDVLDRPFLLKPYHGVHWLENRGSYPFTHHRLAEMPGTMRAVAGDVDGDGDMDIVAVSYLPSEELPEREKLNLDAVLWLEQTSKGVFVRRPLEMGSCDHFTCALARLNGQERPSLIVGNFWSSSHRPLKDSLGIWNSVKESARPVARTPSSP